tara:strand:+ start:185 stop:604 length:420 start_codon:yes stop_codon:yes gene_type:complete
MLKPCLLLLIACTTGCSLKSLLPPSLAVVGGGVGAIGGSPALAATGAGAGAAVGTILVMDDKERESKQMMVDALTSGDVNKLVDSKLKSARDDGFFDSILQEIYGVIKLCVIGCALWFIVPMIYSHWRAKKTEKKWKQT